MNKIGLYQECLAILGDLAEKHPDYQESLLKMKVRISGKMVRAAAAAGYRQNEIVVSWPYFANSDNHKRLQNSVSHEAAHLLTGLERRMVEGPHGPVWKSIHRRLGGTAERCHSMQLADGFTRRARKPRVITVCGVCNKDMILGSTQAKRHMQQKAKGGIGYIHKKCK